jgi:hemerythrin-like domain-containing protein
MMPIGPLMIEHRLIERAIKQMGMELSRAQTEKRFDVHFVASWVDFIRTYADQVHHGKEEKILFRDLENRPLTPPLRQTMAGLIDDHAKARKLVSDTASALDRYIAGEAPAFDDMMLAGKQLVELYPVHIRKEDQEFFVPVMEYFSPEEKDEMLKQFREFDEKVIHDHYRSVVEAMEKGHQ